MPTSTTRSLILLLLLFLLSPSWLSAQSNIDPANQGQQYAWGENVGWINLKPPLGPGVTVTSSAMTGKAWGENIGWITFNPTQGGIVNDGVGRLSGYAWAENVGWINFRPSGGGVSINACGEFRGLAWGENIGWISFRSDAAAPFKITTSWVSPLDDVAPVTTATTNPQLAVWNNTNVSVQLSATDCGGSAKEVHYTFDGGADTLVTGSSALLTFATEGAHSLTYYAVDQAGNLEAAKSMAVRIDKTPPIITLVTPVNGAQFPRDSQVLAQFAVTDPLSGVVNQTSTVPNGAALDTAVAGPHSFSITAQDLAGNISTQTVTYTIVVPGNVDPASAGARYAWGENVGWINFMPTRGPGVTVTNSAVTGLAWGENIGWISMSCQTRGTCASANYGVVNDGAGHLSGFAWSENVGWINFHPAGAGVTINPATGKFQGKAWSENAGWIVFDYSTASPSAAATSWRPPPAGPQNVTASVTIVRGGFVFNLATGRYTQTVSVTNKSPATLVGPLSLVLDNLSGNATLYNRTGMTSSLPPPVSPYLNLNVNLAPGQKVSFPLQFTNPSKSAITYSTRVFAGPGPR